MINVSHKVTPIELPYGWGPYGTSMATPTFRVRHDSRETSLPTFLMLDFYAVPADVGREMIRRFGDIEPGPRRRNLGVGIIQL